MLAATTDDDSDYFFSQMKAEAKRLSSTSLPPYLLHSIYSVTKIKFPLPCLQVDSKIENQKTVLTLSLCKYCYRAKECAGIIFLF